jgi:hypothetical protein
MHKNLIGTFMKTITYIFAILFVAFGTTANAKNVAANNAIPPTAYFNLTALIEENAALEANTELFGIKLPANFLNDVIEENAEKQSNAYILDMQNAKVPANFLQITIEENADRSK